MTQEELDKDMIESIEMWLHEIEPKWVEKELNWLEELRTRLLEEKSEIPNDLEEAADEYKKQVIEETKCHHNALTYAEGYEDALLLIPDAFIAGAKWQEEQDDRLVDIIYQQGIEKGKDEMREQAVSGALAYEPHLRRIIVNLDDIPDDAWNGGGTPVDFAFTDNIHCDCYYD